MKLDNFNLDEDTIKFSNVLNQDIWKNEELKPEVYNKLMEIADAFINYLDLDLDIEDIQFTGSMANYNFNPDSDIDLHIIVNFDKYDINADLLQDYFNAKKTIFNQNHDITIYGHPVELYVEDSQNPAKSGGKYSLKDDKWLIKPEKITQEVEDVKDSPKYKELVNQIIDILSSEYNVDEANEVLDNLYTMRKQGLSNGGELSEDNLIFKKLRSNGYLGDLRTYINRNYDKSLSLIESMLTEDAKADKEFRDLAIKMSQAILKKLNSNKTVFQISPNSLVTSIDEEFRKLDAMLKKADKEFLIQITDKNKQYSFGANDNYNIITLPLLPLPISQYMDKVLKRNYKTLKEIQKNASSNKEYYDGAAQLFKRSAQRYIKEEIKNQFHTYINNLVHECIHLLDSLRRSPTYNPASDASNNIDLNDEENVKKYYNSNAEQNAYYQETAYLFDKWFREQDFSRKNWENFENFYKEFYGMYRGDIKMLTPKNKAKLLKRMYQYWQMLYSV